jgi:hypothetical protein
MSSYSTDPVRARNLILSLGQQLHILQKFLFMGFMGNPSGNLLTSHFGSFWHCVAYSAYFAQTDSTARDGWQGAFYSDDAIVTVPRNSTANLPDAAHYMLKHFGLTVTAEDKTMNFRDHTSWEDVSFLKRRFVRVSIERREFIKAPLDLSSLREQLLWTKAPDGNSEFEEMQQKFQGLSYEAWQHGEGVYEEFARWAKLAGMVYNRSIHFPDYKTTEAEILKRHYLA